jgi:hypothetical protein
MALVEANIPAFEMSGHFERLSLLFEEVRRRIRSMRKNGEISFLIGLKIVAF